jgi:hypothetical protein
MEAMIAAFGTLVFLATLWLLVVVGAMVLEESGARIAAARPGEPQRRKLELKPLRPRLRQGAQPAMRAPARGRAAA